MTEFSAGDAEDLYGADVGHVFMYNEGTDTGFLLWDSDHDGSIDSGVVLAGCGQESDFSELNLV